MKKNRALIFILFILTSFPYLAGQTDVEQILSEIFPVAATTGYEETMMSKIQQVLPPDLPVVRDSLGSLYLSLGEGGGTLSVLVGVDEIGYIVSGFNPEGYLTLDRIVPVPHPLYDSFQFGHPVKIWTQGGPVSGVLAVPSLHIASREIRNDLQSIFSLDNAHVDIGVKTAMEAEAKGVRYLDPVTPAGRICSLAGNFISGPSLGTKVGISVLIDAVFALHNGAVADKTTFVWVAQTKFPARRSRPRAALGAVLAKKNLTSDKFIVIDTYAVDSGEEDGPVLGKGPVLILGENQDSDFVAGIKRIAESRQMGLQTGASVNSLILNPFLQEKNAVGLFIPVKFPATPNEVIDLEDVQTLVDLLTVLIQ